ncbi:PEP-CTERM sorting domain-containing protein [Nostoc sp. B(2019)]|nr:PEP-CTERM sorting domain-containing protein [Nostoc sp. B(2019)]
MKATQILGLTTTFLAVSIISNIRSAEAATIKVIDQVITGVVVAGNPASATAINPDPKVAGQGYNEIITYNWIVDSLTNSMEKFLTYDPAKEYIKTTTTQSNLPVIVKPFQTLTQYAWANTNWVIANTSTQNQPFQLAKITITNEVAPVPEPLTILGTGTALFLGTFFKRQFSKNKEGVL